MRMGFNKWKRRAPAFVAVPLIMFAACGCTGSNGQATPSPEQVQSVAPTSTPSVPVTTTPSTAPNLKAFTSPGGDEKLLGKLDAQRGTNILGPFSAPKKTVIYLDCFGHGVVTLDITGVGQFPTNCTTDSNQMGTRNTFDTSIVGDVLITISGDNSIQWAASAFATSG